MNWITFSKCCCGRIGCPSDAAGSITSGKSKVGLSNTLWSDGFMTSCTSPMSLNSRRDSNGSAVDPWCAATNTTSLRDSSRSKLSLRTLSFDIVSCLGVRISAIQMCLNLGEASAAI